MKKRVWLNAITVLALPLLISGCSTKKEAAEQPNKEKQVLSWSYKGKTGPEHWGSLEKDYAISDTGKKQSPIDIPKQSKTNVLDAEALKLNPNYFEVEKVDQTVRMIPVKAEGRETAQLKFKEKDYILKEISIHTPAEHKISGRSYAGEMQWLLQDKEGKITMLAVLLKEGEKNHAFEEVNKVFSKLENNQKKKTKGVVSTLALLPKDRQFYSYSGSFTTPPTTEDVNWLVFSNPITLSDEQLKLLSDILGDNNRPTQALNGRKISE